MSAGENSTGFYGADRISKFPEKTVWIVQGKRAADAINNIGGVAIFPTSGADFSLVKNRNVILWPNDIKNDSGLKWAMRNAKKCTHTDTVKIIYPGQEGIRDLNGVATWIKSQENPRQAINALEFMDIPSEWIDPTPEELDSGYDIDEIVSSKEIVKSSWESQLSYTKPDKNGNFKIRPTGANLQLIFGNHPLWSGVIAYNTRTLRMMFLRPPPFSIDTKTPCQIQDGHAALCMVWLSTVLDIDASSKLIHEAFSAVSIMNQYDPVRDYFNSLSWDGTPRLHQWLNDFGGALKTPYIEAISTKFALSAVARTYQPGCKVDTMLILEGPQGSLKSTLLREFAGTKNFSDQIGALDSKDTLLKLHGPLIIEMSELDSLNKKESSTIKAFLTTQVDTFRPPYGRTTTDFPRTCVFAGTTNEECYLRDFTGGRRFWPVRVGKIDISGLKACRDQLWAEAVSRYKSGELWYLNGEHETMAAMEQAERLQDDPWKYSLVKYINERCTEYGTANEIGFDKTGIRTYFTVEEMLDKALQMPIDRRAHRDSMRVGQVLKSLGFYRKQVRTRDFRTWGYFIPDGYVGKTDIKTQPEQAEMDY